MQLFISYAHADKTMCKQIYEYLVDAHEVWYDKALFGGQDWWNQILERLNRCDAVIYLLSQASVQSEYCQKECKFALSAGKTLIPVLIQGGTNIPTNISHLQYVNLTNGMTDIYQLLHALTVAERSINRTPINYPTSFRVSTSDPVVKPPPATIPTPTAIKSILPEPFEWCQVRGGTVAIKHGEWKQKKKGLIFREDVPIYQEYRSEVVEVNDFLIGKYPITNAQFQEFLDAPDGYDDHRTWGVNHFGHFGQKDRLTRSDSDPRRNINWLEATAFCDWLVMKINHGSWEISRERSRDGKRRIIIDLPTEAQWQRAAMGQSYDNIKFGYGWEWTKDRASNRDGYGLDSGGILNGKPYAITRGGTDYFNITSPTHEFSRFPQQMTVQHEDVNFRIVCYILEKFTPL